MSNIRILRPPRLRKSRFADCALDPAPPSGGSGVIVLADRGSEISVSCWVLADDSVPPASWAAVEASAVQPSSPTLLDATKWKWLSSNSQSYPVTAVTWGSDGVLEVVAETADPSTAVICYTGNDAVFDAAAGFEVAPAVFYAPDGY